MLDVKLDLKTFPAKLDQSDLDFLISKYCKSFASKSIRFISLNDADRSERYIWINSKIKNIFEHTYRENDSNFLSIAETSFDILIVSGNDFKRIKSILIKNTPALVNKLKICLTNRSAPRDRAELMMAGFDDVIDINRISWEEFCARLVAMHQRLSTTISLNAEQEQERFKITKICKNVSVNEKEKKVLLSMLSKENYTSKSIELRHVICEGYTPATIFHLRVFISNLRKKLADDVFIKSVAGGMYCISLPQDLP